MSRPISSESVFRAIAHPTRRAIVLSLRRGESAVADILPRHPHSKASLSDHLRILQQSGVLTHRRRGTRRFYSLNAGALKPIEQFMLTIQPQR